MRRPPIRIGLLTLALPLCWLLALSVPVAHAEPEPALPAGLSFSETVIGAPDDDDRWVVHVYLPGAISGNLNTADTALGSRAIADRVVSALRVKGFAPLLAPVRTPAVSDSPAMLLGWTVRLTGFPTEAAAQVALKEVKAAGLTGGLRFTAQDGVDEQAPQHVFMLKIDFDEFEGNLQVGHGPKVNGTETLTELMAASGAVAGTNAQWFYDSSPLGLYVNEGKVLGAATQGRGGIRISDGGRRLDVDTFTSRLTLRSGSDEAELDGVNRIPGEVWNCGGVGGDTPTERPQHDLKCFDEDELVRFTTEWGTTPQGPGAEAVIAKDRTVVAMNDSRGAAVPEGGSTIQGIGQQAQWLHDQLSVGSRATITEEVRDGRNRRVPLTRDTTIIQVGPTLVRDGEIAINAKADGLIREGSDQTFTYNWMLRSNPRSMIGTDREGRLMLVVVDGRQAGYSEGLSVLGAAELMQELGAVEALNLDGGGSSVMALQDRGIVNRPSDAAGQRSLGSALLVLPKDG